MKLKAISEDLNSVDRAAIDPNNKIPESDEEETVDLQDERDSEMEIKQKIQQKTGEEVTPETMDLAKAQKEVEAKQAQERQREIQPQLQRLDRSLSDMQRDSTLTRQQAASSMQNMQNINQQMAGVDDLINNLGQMY